MMVNELQLKLQYGPKKYPSPFGTAL